MALYLLERVLIALVEHALQEIERHRAQSAWAAAP